MAPFIFFKLFGEFVAKTLKIRRKGEGGLAPKRC
jgi:hypothetical protein